MLILIEFSLFYSFLNHKKKMSVRGLLWISGRDMNTASRIWIPGTAIVFNLLYCSWEIYESMSPVQDMSKMVGQTRVPSLGEATSLEWKVWIQTLRDSDGKSLHYFPKKLFADMKEKENDERYGRLRPTGIWRLKRKIV